MATGLDAGSGKDTTGGEQGAGRLALAIFWMLVFYGAALGNTAARWLDGRSDGDHPALWPWLCWELSSATASLALLPLLFALCDRFPIHLDNWRTRLLPYWLGSLLWWLLHVSGMVLLRKLAYALAGSSYTFGDWPFAWLYEYAKDLQTYLLLVSAVHGARWFSRRRQGEAQLLAPPDEGPPLEPVDRPERFLVRKLGRDFLVATAEVEWLQASGNYVNLRVKGHDYPLRSTIAGIESKLDPARFVRIQRSYIVNLDQVASIEPLETGDARVHLKDGTTLPVSRTYRTGLRERLGQGVPPTGVC